MNNKYKQFVKYNILNKKTSPFGWYENVYEFKIHSVSTTYDISENGETRDIIKILCEYNDKDVDEVIEYLNDVERSHFNSENGRGGLLYYKTLEYYKSDYDDYITELRNNKLNELGI